MPLVGSRPSWITNIYPTMSLNTIIVEDEPLSRVFLHNLLTEFCPGINVVAKSSTEDDAVASISNLKPDLVFLDIELQQGTGFEVLKRIAADCPYIVFTTAFDHHAMRAIQFSGVEYLHKPIDIEGLQQVIESINEKRKRNDAQQGIPHLLQTLQNNYTPTHLYIPTETGIEYIPVKEIIRIEGCDADSCFILRSGEHKRAKRNLREYELLLNNYSFFRVHQLHLVNLREVNGKQSSDLSTLLMSDKSQVPVSPKKVEELRKLL